MDFKKKWDIVYNENNIRLIKFHILLAIVYSLLAIITFLIIEIDQLYRIIGFTIPFSIASLHIATIFLVKNKLEIGRKISEILGMIILIGFPIGTLIGFFMLPLSVWQNKQEKEK